MPAYEDFKKKIFDTIDDKYHETKLNKVVDFFILTLIILNLLAIVLESFQILYSGHKSWFHGFEIFSVVVFTVEYILRIWTAELKYPSEKAFRARIRYIASPAGIIDVLAILPSYIPLLGVDLRFIRILRLARILRALKLTRYSNALRIVSRVLKSKSDELLATVLIASVLLVVSATLVYYLERDAQPDKFPDIISSIWWAMATLTTIGYGDVFPITIGGKILSCIIAILGIGVVALPAGIISSGFLDEIKNEKEAAKAESEPAMTYCPHCGKKLSP